MLMFIVLIALASRPLLQDLGAGLIVQIRRPFSIGDQIVLADVEGRIDDADAGWKGRGLWVSSGDRTPWLREGGKGSKPLVVHFQMRPNPRAN